MAFTKRSLTTLIAVLALIACGNSNPPAPASTIRVPVTASPQRGPSDAWVTIVEFGDFQCSFCRAEEPAIEALLASFPSDVRLVWKDFPLTQLHPDAQQAAVAAECAFRQGRFWKLHDLLLLPDAPLDGAALLQRARQVPGLDVPAWQACLADPSATRSVASNAALAASLVPGTPTLVINGTPIVGAVSQSELTSIVERARAAAIARGIPRAEYYARVVLGATGDPTTAR